MRQLTGLAALSFLLLSTSAFAQEKRAMTFEDVLAVKSVSDVQVSPDGKWIAYQASPESGGIVTLTTSLWNIDFVNFAGVPIRSGKDGYGEIPGRGGPEAFLPRPGPGPEDRQWRAKRVHRAQDSGPALQ